jgi:hypothetical protein
MHQYGEILLTPKQVGTLTQGPLTKGQIMQQLTSESGKGITFDQKKISGIQRRLKVRHSTKLQLNWLPQ